MSISFVLFCIVFFCKLKLNKLLLLYHRYLCTGFHIPRASCSKINFLDDCSMHPVLKSFALFFYVHAVSCATFNSLQRQIARQVALGDMSRDHDRDRNMTMTVTEP